MNPTIPPPTRGSGAARRKFFDCSCAIALLWWGIVPLLACSERKETHQRWPAGVTEYADLGTAVESLVPPGTRLVGFGELHARTDRPDAASTLAAFTKEVLPRLSARTSHLVLETWTLTAACGEIAERATAAVETTVRRPAATKNELGVLVQESRQRGIAPHAMKVTCDDYQAMAKGDDEAIAHLLDLTTAELGRLGKAAMEKAPAARPLVLIYGGALHNDRSPVPGLEPWSYAAAVEAASARTFVEIDLIVPELALADPATSKAPWARFLGQSPKVLAIERDERSYVVLLPARDEPSGHQPSTRELPRGEVLHPSL